MQGTSQRGAAARNPISKFWKRISPALVPVLAVITALIAIIPFMIVTGTNGNVTEGISLSFKVYTSLLEGSMGVATNRLVEQSDVDLVERLEVNQRDLLLLSSRAEILVRVGFDNVTRYGQIVARYSEPIADANAAVAALLGEDPLTGEEAFSGLGERIPDMRAIGADNLRLDGPLLLALNALPRRDVETLAAQYAEFDLLDDTQRADIEAFVPAAQDYDDDALLNALKLINEYGFVRLFRIYQQFLVLEQLSIEPDSADADAIAAIFELGTDNTPGVRRISELAEVQQRFNEAGITDTSALSGQMRLVLRMYDDGVLTNPNVQQALREELPPAMDTGLLIRLPNNRLLYVAGNTDSTGYVEGNPPVAFAKLGNRVFLFYPDNLEETLTRSLPFIITGLAVALGFKAGLFNIGAEGQLYMGAIFAVWIGFSPRFGGDLALGRIVVTIVYAILAASIAMLLYTSYKANRRDSTTAPARLQRREFLPGVIIGIVVAIVLFVISDSVMLPLTHITLVMLAGIIGGAVWGFIPGALKAYTGAHEVISTIMLNFIAIRLVDWLIKSTDPVILLDTTASKPQTPYMLERSWLPGFAGMSAWWFIGAGMVVLLLGLWSRRSVLTKDLRAFIRPVVMALLVVAGGYFLEWIAVRNVLHVGIVLMIAIVYTTDWFINRTTLGFELRTVGANPNAARYAGMSVRWNTIFALTLAGALAGFAATIQISGVQHIMEPGFFSGLGFDAIAVALLARNNPRNMITAGILWSALLTGGSLMQERATISIDLVKIIQALIIMFIAADVIIRFLWRVPEESKETKVTTFAKGWGG